MTKYPSAAVVPAELLFMSTLQFKYGILLKYHTIAFDFKFLSGLVHKWLEDNWPKKFNINKYPSAAAVPADSCRPCSLNMELYSSTTQMRLILSF